MTCLLRNVVVVALIILSTSAFSVTRRSRTAGSSSVFRLLATTPPPRLSSSRGSIKGQTIPLLDLSDSDQADSVVSPLPSAHLPSELSTLHMYGMELMRPVHKMLLEDVVSSSNTDNERGTAAVYGYIVDKPKQDTLIGAIGCAAEIIINAPQQQQQQPTDTDTSSSVGDSSANNSSVDTSSDNNKEEMPVFSLSKGAYRFVVKEIVKTFPYPVAIVDELLDDEEPLEDESSEDIDEDDGDDDDEDSIYADLNASELVRRIMMGLKTLIGQKLDDKKPELSPLEQSILESEAGVPFVAHQIEQEQAEEMAAIFDIFQSSLLDLAPTPVERYYAVSMLAAEMTNVDNDVRKQLLVMTDGIARMRIVLKEIDEAVSLNQARKVADAITNDLDEDKKDLKVGAPQLPSWVDLIKDGTRIEYFWSEQDGWCGGVVDGEPRKIVDEVIVTVRFDDGETHRLPITPDEKVRWRPPQQ